MLIVEKTACMLSLSGVSKIDSPKEFLAENKFNTK